MAYDTSKIVKLGQLETALKECEAGLSDKLSLRGGTITGSLYLTGTLYLYGSENSGNNPIGYINGTDDGDLSIRSLGEINMGDITVNDLTASAIITNMVDANSIIANGITITPAQIQRGSSQVADAGYGTYRTFTFPEAFSNVPTVIATLRSDTGSLAAFNSFYNKTTGYTDIIPYNVTTSGFSIRWEFASDVEVEDAFYIDWIAIATA